MAQPLTFGVEFEFLVRDKNYKEHCDEDYTSDPRRIPFRQSSNIYKEIQEVLRDAGVSAFVEYIEPDQTELTNWRVSVDVSVSSREPEDKDGRKRRGWSSVELISPPLPYTEASIENVRAVCKVIVNSFRVLINETCGFHVHVGNRSLSFPLEAVQNLMAFERAFEPQMKSIHPPVRHASIWVLSWDKLRIHDPKHTTAQAVGKIYSYTTMPDLVHNLTEDVNKHAGKPAIKLYLNPEDKSDVLKRTIEFRMHEGTMDGDRAVAWIDLVVGLVQGATKWPKAVFMDFINEYSGKSVEELPASELFEQFGLFKSAADYRGAIKKDFKPDLKGVSEEECLRQAALIKVPHAPLANLEDKTDEGISYAYSQSVFPSRKRELTYGIELEFLVKKVYPGDEDPEPDCGKPAYFTKTTHMEVRDKLRAAGIACKTSGEGYDEWTVETDYSLENLDERYDSSNCDRVELVSPVFTYGNQEHAAQIAKVLSTLASNFRLEMNRTTGLHVHIGNGIDHTFAFDSLKNAMAMFYILEPSLSAIHHADRQNNDSARSLRRHANVVALCDVHSAEYDGNALPVPQKKPVADVVAEMYAAADVVSLCRLAEGTEHRFDSKNRMGHLMAYNFDNLHWNMKGGPVRGTIEFRQAMATVDADFVTNWIELLCTLMERASYTAPSAFLPFLKENMVPRWVDGEKGLEMKDGPTYDVVDICTALTRKNASIGADFAPLAYYRQMGLAGKFIWPDLDRWYGDDAWSNTQVQYGYEGNARSWYPAYEQSTSEEDPEKGSLSS